MADDFRRSPLTIYVPALGSDLDKLLLPRSGMVGARVREGDPESPVLVYYEGARYRPSNIVTWADKVFHAADRMLWRGVGYPTVAQSLAQRDDLLPVGQFFHPERRIEISDSEKLAAWLGKDALEYPDSAEPELQFTR